MLFARERQQHLVFAIGDRARCSINLIDEVADGLRIGGHLVSRIQIRPVLIAEQVGEFFTLLQQIGEHRNILRIRTGFICKVHAAAQVRAVSKIQHRGYIRRVTGESDAAVRGRLVEVGPLTARSSLIDF